MPDLPDGWTWRQVKELGDVQIGRQLSPSQKYGPHMRPYLRVANVHDGYIDYSDVLDMNFTPSEFEVFSLKPGDILLNEGQSIDLVGRSAIYDGPPGMCFQNTLIRFRSWGGVLPEFAQAVFSRWLCTGKFSKIARQTTSIAHLGADRFASMLFPVPPLEEQRRIAEILDDIDFEIDVVTSRTLKQNSVHSGLVAELIRSTPGSMVPVSDIAVGGPAGSVIGPFGSSLVADDYQSEGCPVVFVRDIRANSFEWISEVYVSGQKAKELGAHEVLGGDLLLTKMGLPPCVAAIYPVWMKPGVITADVVRVRLDEAVANAIWVSSYINSEYFARQVRAITGGVTRPKVTLAEVRKLLVKLPALEDQCKFEKLITESHAAIDLSMKAKGELMAVRRGLMEDMLAGRVRVA
ncbi:restriction endonuclease subunit S [Actinomadura geliboluensis]|uniref:restriction endonuclease subunit S n=1 Tax=Actinomadura geliboluensis TaxID=882440 RepID=UPI00261B00D7|nr:restriction endonuclease subunit S [Actinomadura geliboluensis]